ncbi:Alpha/Beta hydrolase protein, partial [Kalaharituber pfeilii]
ATFLATNHNSASIEASQATSAALTELSKHLDTCLSEVDFEGNLSGQHRTIERRLTVEAEKYVNCSLDQDLDAAQDGIKKWHCTKEEADMVSIAMKMSDAAYDNEREPEEEGFRLEKQWYIPATVTGTTKATTFTIVNPKNESTSTEAARNSKDEGGFPLLVIAVKGSRSAVDWMVNSNGTPRSVGDFCNLSHLLPPTRSATKHPDPVKAHSGFLHCAHALLPQVRQELHKLIKEFNTHNVLFTGHSAGGAVASLLFTHFLSISHRDYKNIKFSLVTFGAPPVTSPDITPLLLRSKVHRGTFLAICNEYDPVPRADSEYIRSLLDLHRSAYGLPPLPEPNKATSSTAISQCMDSIRRRVTSTGEWILPTPVLHPLGRLIILKDRNADGDGMDLYTYEVKGERFEKLLFVKVAAHRRGVYLENVERVRKGSINGWEGW